MVDPLSMERAKKALGDVARGRVPGASRLTQTPEQAKEKLRSAARGPDLVRLATTQPFLAVTMAVVYGFVLGGSRPPGEKFLDGMHRALTTGRPS